MKLCFIILFFYCGNIFSQRNDSLFRYADKTGHVITLLSYKKFPQGLDTAFFKREVSEKLFLDHPINNADGSFDLTIHEVKKKKRDEYELKVMVVFHPGKGFIDSFGFSRYRMKVRKEVEKLKLVELKYLYTEI
ncbi:MAG TPA: hypothetical protein VI112_07900 [Bacteroidia bacterium]|jgi:hypothetical protein